MVYFMENPMKMDDDWGYPYDLGNLQIGLIKCKQVETHRVSFDNLGTNTFIQ